uniref:Uncharacterized protein n=1 Tax=Physcomitrium patens TaxID=3218 RepID=A0A2K1KJF6_PHYPA|nr:hypothetical protein PHYPA_007570 [Physcomitrium patens]
MAMRSSSVGSVFLYVRPVIQFTDDDEIVGCRLGTSEAHIFGGRDLLKGTIYWCRLPGINGVQLAHIYFTYCCIRT